VDYGGLEATTGYCSKLSDGMLKWLLLISAGLISCFLMTGCSTTHGNIGHSIVTDVQLSQANYTLVKTVSGSAKADYAVGIGHSEQDLRAQAKREIISKETINNEASKLEFVEKVRMVHYGDGDYEIYEQILSK